MGSEAPRPKDYVSRVKRPSPWSLSLSVGLRLLDPLLQHAIMTRGLGSSLIRLCGAKTLPMVATTNTNALGLAPYQMAMFSLAVGATLSETFWILYILREEMLAGQAVSIAAFNTINNSLNTLLSMCVLTSAMDAYGDLESLLQSPALVFGTIIYVIGMLLQTVSELQRRSFKKDPANEGKPYGGGLFSVATHVNFGGYTLWRTGYAMASAGWGWAAVSNAWFIYDFTTRGMPVLENYSRQKVSPLRGYFAVFGRLA
ncbi:hypothetical protein FGG08_004391 [Glutinoglossum americanum]|uniref:Steroid 5-alpha reductase C-terminal domain-containing protein n=1 Tax=Glutinoglossum americanum TaxID=1670608 RepID=A0A9P8I5T9_9PEZI|nr:hypothetical protein FGG08_004391 [Glutinoglossum americanum]